MNQQLALVFTTFLYILILCVLGRSLLTWFPIDRNHPIARILHQVTEPLLAPVRRILPQTGKIDLSGMAVIIVLYVMVAVVNQAAAQ